MCSAVVRRPGASPLAVMSCLRQVPCAAVGRYREAFFPVNTPAANVPSSRSQTVFVLEALVKCLFLLGIAKVLVNYL